MNKTQPSRLIVGIGNAGVSVLDLLSVENPGMRDLLVVNNDTESLSASIVADRLIVPEGDLGDGFLSIDDEFGSSISGASAVLLCGGLGGETASFLLPALAIRSKSAGLPTLACVGMPFSFEGKQKRDLALEALEKLRAVCDGVVVINNDQLSGGTPSSSAVGEAFQLSDRTLIASLLAMRGMLATSGPVKITRSDLHAVLGVPGSVTHFGFGSSHGSNRLHEALERALKSPLLSLPGKGQALREAKMVLLFFRAPKDLSFSEVQLAVAEIERIAGERCLIKVGVQSEGSPESPLELFITASSGGSVQIVAKSNEPKPFSLTATETRRGSQQSTPVAAKADKPLKKSSAKQMQGTLDLESYQRGRFDKSEPTIIGGEDLDVPTFLRKGIKITTPARH
jgi:cell division protein FtsZ